MPNKFGIDKRKAHLTCLIISTGEITREEALKKLAEPTLDEEILKHDIIYFLKKLNFTQEQFDNIMALPPKTILDYPNMHSLEMKFRRMLNYLRSKKLLPN